MADPTGGTPETTRDTSGRNGTGPSSSDPIEEIEVQVAEARQELGETVAALSAKLDVKTRTKDKAAEVREEHGQQIAIAGAAAAVALLVLLVVRRRRRS